MQLIRTFAAVLALCASAASQSVTLDTGYVRASGHDEPLRSYPYWIPSAPSGCTEIVGEQRVSYRYRVLANNWTSAPMLLECGATCIYWLSHEPAGTFLGAFAGLQAGGGGFFSVVPPGPQHEAVSPPVVYHPSPLAFTGGDALPFLEAQRWRGDIGYRRVWFTPVAYTSYAATSYDPEQGHGHWYSLDASGTFLEARAVVSLEYR